MKLEELKSKLIKTKR